MSEPVRQLKQVGEATRAVRGVADQALEWVRVSEERVAAAEKRADEVRDKAKAGALLTLRKVTAEAREKIAAERKARVEAESRIAAAEAARDRAECGFEELQRHSQREREEIVAETSRARETAEQAAGEARAEAERAVATARAAAEETIAEERRASEQEFKERLEEARQEIQAEADKRIAAAE
jgi:colicin import membrane protein